jgi:hypothetical protein
MTKIVEAYFYLLKVAIAIFLAVGHGRIKPVLGQHILHCGC